ncbi:MAG: hypothetical protein HY751_03490 [Nitrospinae bacterium]|nr:hypothetical protein [Nitrospinota bacterium]
MKPGRGNRGMSALLVVIIMAGITSLGLAALMVSSASFAPPADTGRSVTAFYAAQSGLEWFRQRVSGYTTSNRQIIENLDGTTMRLGQNGPEFSLTAVYVDADSNPQTDDIVTITSTGRWAAGDGNFSRTVSTSLTIPAGGSAPYFMDSFDQPDTDVMDTYYETGQASAAHAVVTPYATVTTQSGGDTLNLITHPSEPGGIASILKITAQGDTRLLIHTAACFKLNTLGAGDPCAYAQCQSAAGCFARQGINIAPDQAGYQNYFIKTRVKLVSGAGFGLYFRASYPSQADPNLVDLGGLTGYIWQYDMNIGYIAPCDTFSAVFGNDGAGMLLTRKVFMGSETCATGCEVFNSQNPDTTYPFFCPENRTGLTALNGWRWGNGNWTGLWRTVYIYVYQNMASIYLGLEEITAGQGSETQPYLVETVLLDSAGTAIATGDIGIRAWGGSVILMDYFAIYPNDLNYDPSTFSG